MDMSIRVFDIIKKKYYIFGEIYLIKKWPNVSY
jgi:hypothetical protein